MLYLLGQAVETFSTAFLMKERKPNVIMTWVSRQFECTEWVYFC